MKTLFLLILIIVSILSTRIKEEKDLDSPSNSLSSQTEQEYLEKERRATLAASRKFYKLGGKPSSKIYGNDDASSSTITSPRMKRSSSIESDSSSNSEKEIILGLTNRRKRASSIESDSSKSSSTISNSEYEFFLGIPHHLNALKLPKALKKRSRSKTPALISEKNKLYHEEKSPPYHRFGLDLHTLHLDD